jgi:predicted TIM-barrel fold metal-dependent hydrolase
MSFDFRVFLGESYDGTSQKVDELLRRMDALSIEMALTCPFRTLSCDLDQANRDLAEEIKDHADRLIGAVRVDPWQPDAIVSLREGLEKLGLCALYLNPWEENFRADIERLDKLMEVAAQFNIPVLVATGFPWLSEALQVRTLASRWPDVPVVMTNGGQINISGLGQADVTLAMQQHSNLYIDTAGIYRQDFIEETVEEFGADRVLFASGSPYFDQRYEIKRVQLAKVNENKRRAMSSGNACRLLNLENCMDVSEKVE